MSFGVCVCDTDTGLMHTRVHVCVLGFAGLSLLQMGGWGFVAGLLAATAAKQSLLCHEVQMALFWALRTRTIERGNEPVAKQGEHTNHVLHTSMCELKGLAFVVKICTRSRGGMIAGTCF